MSWDDDAEVMLEKEQADREKLSSTQTWKPKEGDVLKGKLLEGKIIDGEYGPCKVLNIEDSDGKVWSVWAGNKLLKEAVDAQAPAQGKGVSIKFDGLKQPKRAGGREYGAYYMVVEVSDHEYWANVSRAFYANAEALDPAGGGGVPADGLADPF